MPAVLALSLACCALVVGTAGASKPAVAASRLVLTLDDLGGGYRINPGLTGNRSFQDVSLGDSVAVRKELSRSWLRGAEHAFNGVSVQWGVVSLADIFRESAHMDLILRAWQDDAVRISKGERQPLPSRAPGTGGVLVRGHLLQYELLIYMWRRGSTISSVDVTGAKDTVPVSLVMKLARRQDARVLSAVR